MVRLALLLASKVQSAYTAMRVEDVLDYRVLKEAILKQYEISEDSSTNRNSIGRKRKRRNR